MHIVLGRFQPFHNGHAHLIESALALGPTTIAIGSSQESWTPDNPWSGDEREAMIRAWLGNREATIVQIEDINDPPNWVEHAKKTHGEGIIVTSDKGTKDLYEEAGWTVNWVELIQRDSYEGWRVRSTLKMLSTVAQDDAQKEVMMSILPAKISEWLLLNDGLYRFYEISKSINHVG
jgi:cytidyltransferase-like protein